MKIQYRYRPAEYGEQLVRMYILTNDKDSKLGTTPMPDGAFRVFRQNGRDGLSFLAAQAIKYVPIGDKIELNLGTDPEVIFELVKLRTWRDDLEMQVNGANIFRRVDQPGVQIEINSSVAGWDAHTSFAQRVRNSIPAAVFSVRRDRVSVARWQLGRIFAFRQEAMRRVLLCEKQDLPKTFGGWE